jgi:ligand-binding SRPBCC domain-containing protein
MVRANRSPRVGNFSARSISGRHDLFTDEKELGIAYFPAAIYSAGRLASISSCAAAMSLAAIFRSCANSCILLGMKLRVVKRTQVVSRPIEEAFAFFSNPRIVEFLTPSKMQFRLVGKIPESIELGTILNYQLYFYRVPLRWQVRIERFEPPNCFVNFQEKGPFARWRHTQTFVAAGNNTTEVRDRFEFGLPFGRVGEFVYRSVVKESIIRLFDYRANKMDALVNQAVQRTATPQASSESSHQSPH